MTPGRPSTGGISAAADSSHSLAMDGSANSRSANRSSSASRMSLLVAGHAGPKDEQSEGTSARLHLRRVLTPARSSAAKRPRRRGCAGRVGSVSVGLHSPGGRGGLVEAGPRPGRLSSIPVLLLHLDDNVPALNRFSNGRYWNGPGCGGFGLGIGDHNPCPKSTSHPTRQARVLIQSGVVGELLGYVRVSTTGRRSPTSA